MKRYKYFIGIDVSKLTLDFAIMNVEKLIYHKKIANEDTAIASMLVELKEINGFKLSNSVFGMEHTGIYSNKILSILKRKKANIVYENPTHIKNSLGNLRGKNDKLDSIRIATYLKKLKDDLRLWQGKRKIIQELASLVALRDRLARTKRALKTPLKEDLLFISTKFAIQN
ncbi:IS110 family transposase [Pedobacter agri]|uniref:IS110 family transposase n=1 Tax=Pedobacter agri TaxID=454586 RepID=UPI002781E292|nr:transposase [Pedobacter agri]MDQ1142923.1 transposase [Pedobacter agri]